ncbi:receptor expression-enhancing protein 5-like isoform X2 [Ornithodoros turicata]|uniref:receptor expression-enhancing protein 5-like isoform X2 n=1 Tax=Ornithodoros turicata TaxID=34597 RepID=UPI003138CA05
MNMSGVKFEVSAALREKGVINNVLAKIESISRIKREAIVYALAGFAVLMFLLNFWGRRMTNIITTVWPIIGSLRAMDKACTASQTKWLGYWIVYVIVNSFEFIFIGLETRIRRVFIIKLIILTLAAVPHSKAVSVLMYEKALRNKVYKGPADAGGSTVQKMEKMAEKLVEKVTAEKSHSGGSHMSTGTSEVKSSPAKESPKPNGKKSKGMPKKGHK